MVLAEEGCGDITGERAGESEKRWKQRTENRIEDRDMVGMGGKDKGTQCYTEIPRQGVNRFHWALVHHMQDVNLFRQTRAHNGQVGLFH